ncbi:MAG TPA: hypothetical protein VGG76_03645 [Gemmatimonadaceae bacterium]|jgi:hypothetical protein
MVYFLARAALTLALMLPARSIRRSEAMPAIPALVGALRTHSVAAIGELHWCRQAGDFYIALVRDPGFQRVVNDIVVEFASGQSQALLDRYIVAGDSISPDTLRTIWRNTTKAASWESPIYARWLAAIRDVNRALPPGRRIRVLAGDTPIDWNRLHSQADWNRLGDNNVTFANVIEKEVIAKGRKALVVLGNNHLARGGTFRDRATNTASLVEAKYPGSMYLALIYYGPFGDSAADWQIAVEQWPAPAVFPLARNWTGNPVGTSAGQLPLAAFADALLYLGPRNALTIENPPPGALDSAYRRELARRSWIEFRDSTRVNRILPPAGGSGRS